MEWRELKGKNIYVKTNSDRIYTAKVTEVEFIGKDEFGSDIYIISFTDKYGKYVAISIKDIKFLEIEK